MRADYHTHTYLCAHAEGTPREYTEAAIRAGLVEIGISDHSPFPADIDTGIRMQPSEWELYKKLVDEAREVAAGRIKVRFGVEIDWFPGYMDASLKLIDSEPFDYVIGSVHYINGEVFDNPYDLSIWEPPGAPDRIWTAYMKVMMGLVECGCADIIGHFDLPKKFGYYPSPKVMESVDEQARAVLKLAGEKGMCMELNTSGWGRQAAECYPSEKYLRMAAESGVGLTLGSDAHTPGNVGMYFDRAVELALHCGFTHLTLFEARRQTKVPLA